MCPPRVTVMSRAEPRALLGQPSPTDNGAVQIYTSRGYKKHQLGKKKTRVPIVEGGNGVSFVLVSSLAIFHVHCE